jgi:large subunit ribosomal protein L15
MKLNQLSDNAGARQPAKRVGRGIASGTGKTAGRGVKGQKSRSGVAIKGFEGGQMPIHMRMPKRGFTPPSVKSFTVVNVGRLQKFIDEGKLDAKETITVETLIAAGLVRRAQDGVRILAKGDITAKVTLEVQGASKTAVEAVEKAGGKINIVTIDVAPIKNGKTKKA